MSKTPRLSDGVLRYMAALYDTRGVLEDPWVPWECRLSQKVKSWSRGTFSTGTTGIGFVTVTAQAFSDVAAGISSTATSVATAATTIAATTNTVSLANSNSCFAVTQVGATVGLMNWRPVGCTLYVKYAGTQNNKGGDMILLEEPQHASTNAYTYNSALGVDGAKRVDVSDKWQSISWCPGNNQGVDETVFSFSSSTNANRTLAIFVNSAGAPQPFDYEIYWWTEFAGALARSPTLSFNDPIGFTAVQGAGQMFNQLDSELGIAGFIRAVEAQLNNQSLPRTEPPTANFVGLLSFLPQLAALAGPYIKGAIQGALNVGSQQQPVRRPERPPEAPRRVESLRPPAPPRRVESLRPPPPPPRTVSLKSVPARKKRGG